LRIVEPIPAVAALAALAALACGSGDRGGFLGSPPEPTPIRLLQHDARVTGEAPMDATGALLDLDGPALADWTTTSTSGSVRFASPILATGGLADVGRLRVWLRPAGATGVSVVPHPLGDQLVREHRALRRLELALEPGHPADAPLELSIDLHEALSGSFGDASRSGRLSKLELLLAGADPERAALERVVVEPRRALPPGAVAAREVADRAGMLRPAWAIAAGARVEIDVTLPDGAPELRWLDAASESGAVRRIEIETTGETTPLVWEEDDDAAEAAPWTPRAHSLARWAGRRVLVRLAVDGRGVGFFGVPTVVAPARTDARHTPDVLVYLIDTLRADHLGVGGSKVPGVSPTLDRLAKQGVWFRRAQSGSPWTKPAIATLMTGVLPLTHRVGATSYTDRLPASVPLLQERFRDAGWRTGSFSASPLGSTLSSLERGFDVALPPRFWRERPGLDTNPAADQLGDALLDWIDEQPDRPFFGYVHTLEVHEWKLPRYREAPLAGGSAYDAAIRDADRHLGELLAALAGRERPLWLVVVSDHGESWGDHGMPSHGFGLYQSQTHVPLIFWRSTAATPRAVDTPVGLADLAPTLLDGFGLAGLEGAEGRSLVPALRGEELAGRPVLSSLLRFVWAPNAPRQHAITTPDQVSLIRPESGVGQAFDLLADPRELRPAPPDPALVRALDEILARQVERAADFERRHGPVVPGAVGLDDAERLRALGYLGTPPGSAPAE